MFVCGDRAISTKNILTIVIIYGNSRESDKIRIYYQDGQMVDMLIPEDVRAREVFHSLLMKIQRDEKNA